MLVAVIGLVELAQVIPAREVRIANLLGSNHPIEVRYQKDPGTCSFDQPRRSAVVSLRAK